MPGPPAIQAEIKAESSFMLQLHCFRGLRGIRTQCVLQAIGQPSIKIIKQSGLISGTVSCRCVKINDVIDSGSRALGHVQEMVGGINVRTGWIKNLCELLRKRGMQQGALLPNLVVLHRRAHPVRSDNM